MIASNIIIKRVGVTDNNKATVAKPAIQPPTEPVAMPATPWPPNGSGANTKAQLRAMLTKFTCDYPQPGVRVSPEPRSAAFTANTAPLSGPDKASTRR